METQERLHRAFVNFEKRKHPRFDVDLPVEYDRIEAGLRQGRAVNASEGGLLLYVCDRMEIGDIFSLKLTLPLTARAERIEALVQVAWIDFHWEEDWGEYRIGVRFVDLSSEDLQKLRNFLKALSE